MPSNRFVDYLNSLRTQASSGNAFCFHEARGDATALGRFGLELPDVLVRTKLDALAEAASKPEFPFRSVILTGDAGDGKTACCERFAERLAGRPLTPAERTRKRLEGPEFGEWTILKDGSELSNPEVPREHLETIFSDELGPGKGRFFLAVNEGRLRSAAHRIALDVLWKPVVEPALDARESNLEAVNRAAAAMRSSRVLVVHLRDRCTVASPQVFQDLVASLTAPTRWEQRECVACPAAARCHMIENAKALREPLVRASLRRVLVAAYDSGQALPFRRVQGYVASLITGGHSCVGEGPAPAVQSGTYGTDPERALAFRYYNLAFAQGPVGDSVEPEPLARFLQRFDPALIPAAECDRLLAGAVDPETLRASLRLGVCAHERAAIAALAGKPDGRAQLVRSLKRKASFEGGGAGQLGAAISAFGDRFFLESFDVYDRAVTSGPRAAAALREAKTRVVRGLNGLDRRDDGDLSLYQLDPQELSAGSRFGLFYQLKSVPETSLEPLPPPPPSAAEYLEHRPSALVFRARDGSREVSLRVDLPLFELLDSVAHGFRVPQAFGTYLHDVQRFKERLVTKFGGPEPKLSIRRGTRQLGVRVGESGKLQIDEGGAQ